MYSIIRFNYISVKRGIIVEFFTHSADKHASLLNVIQKKFLCLFFII